jgi:polyphosphate kinase
VHAALLRQRVIDECLVPYLHDDRDAWTLLPDGRYTRSETGTTSAQQSLMQRFGAGP